jgi:hypothetical protein
MVGLLPVFVSCIQNHATRIMKGQKERPQATERLKQGKDTGNPRKEIFLGFHMEVKYLYC